MLNKYKILRSVAKGYQHNILPCRLLLFGFAREIEHLIISIIPNNIIDICISYTFQQLEVLVTDYDILIKNLNNNNTINSKQKSKQIKLLLNEIRSSVLLNGVPNNYSLSINNDKSSSLNKEEKEIENKNKNEEENEAVIFHNDTLRGKLWNVMLGLSSIQMDINKYQSNMHENNDEYVKIRGDSKRTFLTSSLYNSRVNESQVVRLLNVYVNIHNTKYLQAWDCYVGILLYSMPELYAYYSFEILLKNHISTYNYHDNTRKYDLIGGYAGSYLSHDILKIIDNELFIHLNQLPAHAYLLPATCWFHNICQPFEELLKLWDFMICFGMYLSPIITVAELISIKDQLLQTNVARALQGILSQRKYLNQRLNAKKVIEISMNIICTLKANDKYKKLWNQILNHASDLNVALHIKQSHE